MGRFIVIEGLDGAGTTTQVERLVDTIRARGQAVLATREPTSGPIGRIIRQTLRAEPDAPAVATLPWMFAADRADHLSRTVDPALADGTWVVSDRYYHSSLAYQSLTLPLDDVLALNGMFRVPDVTVYLDVPVGVCLDRIERRGGEREIYEHRERLQLISRHYRTVIDTLWARGEPIVEIDATGTADEVQQRINKLILEQ
jgi:dTMP kinase